MRSSTSAWLGGSITGEHGIGVEKREFLPRMFDPPRWPRCAGSRGPSTRSSSLTGKDVADDGRVRPPERRDLVTPSGLWTPSGAPPGLPRGGGSKPALSTPPEGVVPLVCRPRGIVEYDPES